MDFYLMSKDRKVLRFSVLGGGSETICKIVEEYEPSLKPLNLRDIKDWLWRRSNVGYRFYIEKFLKHIDLMELYDLILTTKCISLSDTFWVKSTHSEMKWSSISPFRHSPDSAVSDYSLKGSLTSRKVTSSPEFSTDGTFAKCWGISEGKLRLYKAGTDGACNAGNEPYSEVYASKIASLMGLTNYVPYWLEVHKGVLVSVCDCFTSESEGMIQFKALDPSIRTYKELLSGKGHEYGSNEDKLDMLLFDYLTCNVDRHFGNISMRLDTEKNQVIGLSKIYDYNLSCVPYYTRDEDLEDYIASMRTADDSTWEELLELIDCSYVRARLTEFTKNYKYIRLHDSLDAMLSTYGCDEASIRLKSAIPDYRKLGVSFERDGIVNRMIDIQLRRAGV